MKPHFYIVSVAFLLIIFGCKHSASKLITEKPKTIDTGRSFKIARFWVTPKKSFDFNSLNKADGDTLDLAICSNYVYAPFGIIKGNMAFDTSLLKNFSVKSRSQKMDVGTFTFQILNHGSSKLLFFFDNDPETQRHSDIFKGEIYDEDVQFVNGIKIGMSLHSFYKTFFDYFPEALQKKYNVIVLNSCINDITHTYTFKNDKLNSVKFINDSYWKIDY